jgi:hypothetical protein
VFGLAEVEAAALQTELCAESLVLRWVRLFGRHDATRKPPVLNPGKKEQTVQMMNIRNETYRERSGEVAHIGSRVRLQTLDM